MIGLVLVPGARGGDGALVAGAGQAWQRLPEKIVNRGKLGLFS